MVWCLVNYAQRQLYLFLVCLYALQVLQRTISNGIIPSEESNMLIHGTEVILSVQRNFWQAYKRDDAVCWWQ
jgi:hypothetical protein